MKATVPYLQEQFDVYNREFFGGELPPIPIALSNARTFIGKFYCKCRRSPFGGIVATERRIRINGKLDFEESFLQDTLIHEMIHYYINYKGLHDSSSHGPVFRSIMERINREGGRHITVSVRLSPEQSEQLRDSRPRWHVIALIAFGNGDFCVKNLPRVESAILHYDKAMKASGRVQSIEYYMELDPWFDSFPKSSAVNAFRVRSKEEVMSHITGRIRLQVDKAGVKVISEHDITSV